MRLLDGMQTTGVKLGPALPHSVIRKGVDAEWITRRGETVEVALWAGADASPRQRSALVMPNSRLAASGAPPLAVRELGRYLYEHAGAVIRAGAIAALGAQLGAGLLDSQIAYLTSDQLCMTPLATAFEVREQLPFHLKAPHKWVRQGQIGVLENKKRGVDVEPAELRRRLRLSGPNSATIGDFADTEPRYRRDRRAGVTTYVALSCRAVTPPGGALMYEGDRFVVTRRTIEAESSLR
jgi:hypothetical protein